MPPRLSKRQQRELEELETLAGPSGLKKMGDEEEPEDEFLIARGVSKRVTGFAALAGDDDEQELDLINDDNKSTQRAKSKKSKKKKKGTGNMDNTSLSPATKHSTKAKPKVKNNPKSKAKLKAEEQEFDKALAELSGRYSASHSSMSTSTKPAMLSSYDTFHSLFSVSLKHLDPDTELRRFFGSKVITSSAPPRTSRVRSHLARPQPAWPPAQYRAGLSMRSLTPEEMRQKDTGVGPDSRECWWTVEASPRYKGTTYEFMQCVMSGDPQLFFNLMYEMPWHADTLLQMAEVYRHREEYSTAADFMSRALFAYERAFAGAFNLTTGVHRLDFDRVENRVFYLALSRNVVDLNRRGTPRTSYEFARLLYALDPHTDPHGALLHLDSLAIKSRQLDWLLAVWDAYSGIGAGVNGETRFDVTFMPGWCWARALALFEKEGKADEEHRESTQALRHAILSFPSVVPLLADKIDLVVPSELRNMDSFKIITDYSPYRDDLPTSLIHLLSHIYVTRSFPLWKPSDHATWLLKTLKSFTPSNFTSSTQPGTRARLISLLSSQSNITDAIYRHVLVVGPLMPEFRRLTSFFPAEVKTRLTHTIEGDPLPPVTAVSIYNDAYFLDVGVESRRDGMRSPSDRIAEHMQRVFPNPVDRGQLQALFDAHPEIGARFPGGAVELAQLARQFPQEVLEAVIGMVAMNHNDNGGAGEIDVQDGRMPGGEAELAQEGVEERGDVTAVVPEREGEDDAEEEDGDDEGEAFLPVRIVQNLFGRLWGRNSNPEHGGDSGSDSDNVADEGVRAGNAAGLGSPRADDVD